MTGRAAVTQLELHRHVLEPACTRARACAKVEDPAHAQLGRRRDDLRLQDDGVFKQDHLAVADIGLVFRGGCRRGLQPRAAPQVGRVVRPAMPRGKPVVARYAICRRLEVKKRTRASYVQWVEPGRTLPCATGTYSTEAPDVSA